MGSSEGEVLVVHYRLCSLIEFQVQDGESVSFDKLPSLEVTILYTPFTLPVGGTYPVAGEPVFYHEITCGRPGGYKGIYDSEESDRTSLIQESVGEVPEVASKEL